MKKSPVFLLLAAFVIGISAALATNASAPPIASYIQSGANCVLDQKPENCDTTSDAICTVLGVTHYQTKNSPTQCFNAFRMPN